MTVPAHSHANAIAAWVRGRRAAELDREGDGYRMMPCPVPPFRSDDDRRAALGAALVFVAREITGEWPKAERVKAAVDALLPGEGR